MTDFGGGILGVWGWLSVAAQGVGGAAEATIGPAPDFPFWQHLMRVAAVLSGMLGVLVLGLYLWKRSGVLRAQGASSPLIQVLATHHLAPKKALLLVSVGPDRLLLASCGEQLQLVASLSPETSPVPAAAAAEPAPPCKPSLPHDQEGRS